MTVTESRLARVPKVESKRGGLIRRQRVVVNGAMLVGATLLAGSGAIHLHLWLSGYRAIDIIGPLFLTQAVSALSSPSLWLCGEGQFQRLWGQHFWLEPPEGC